MSTATRLPVVREWLTGRSSLFEAWLMKQPVAKRLEILAAGRAFGKEHGERLATATHVFRECMAGYAETPAGSNARQAFHPIGVVENVSGDWSWKPARDEALGPDHVSFAGVPPSTSEACIRAGIHKGHGWRGL